MSSSELPYLTYPLLLDRLTDRGDEDFDRTRPFEQSLDEHRHQVLRDISNLLNAKALHPMRRLALYPRARQSVVNYGLPDVAGKTRSQLSDDQIANMIRFALQSFEPRLESSSLRVIPLAAPDWVSPSHLSFLIEGAWWSLPYPERLWLRTYLDLETGRFDVYEDDRSL
jgi:type VI secretion system protein ImpF